MKIFEQKGWRPEKAGQKCSLCSPTFNLFPFANPVYYTYPQVPNFHKILCFGKESKTL